MRVFDTVLPLALAWSLALTGCKKQQETELPICKAEVAGSEAEEVAAGEVPADIWFLIMLQNFDRSTMVVQRPVRDCSGREVDEAPAPEVAACLASTRPEAALIPPGPLTEDDLLISPLPDGRLLVWVKSTRYDNGEATGPIAIAQWSKRGVLIRAIGTLRAHHDRASMRLEPMGAGQVLVVESRSCDPDDPRKCARMLELMPLALDRFVEAPLVTDDGACIGPAQFEMFREKEIALGNGLKRTFEMARSISFEEGSVVLSEQVTIKDSDPAQPELPAKLFRTASIQRPLRLEGQRMVTKSGLWNAMLQEHGSVALQPEADPESSGTGTGTGTEKVDGSSAF